MTEKNRQKNDENVDYYDPEKYYKDENDDTSFSIFFTENTAANMIFEKKKHLFFIPCHRSLVLIVAKYAKLFTISTISFTAIYEMVAKMLSLVKALPLFILISV